MSWLARTWRPTRAAAIVALIAALVLAVPLAQLPATGSRFDAAMTAAGLGARLNFLNLAATPAVGSSSVRRAVAVGAAGSTLLTADIYARDGLSNAPLLVQVYGGPWQRGRPGDDEAFARYFAARGYVVAAIDYRHAPAARWPAQIDDVRTAIAWLRAHARDVLETYLGGTPDQVPDRYAAASPVTYVSRTSPPTLLVYGRRDHVVEVRFARRLEARLHEVGVPAVRLELPWSEHAFDALPHGLSGASGAVLHRAVSCRCRGNPPPLAAVQGA